MVPVYNITYVPRGTVNYNFKKCVVFLMEP